MKNGPCTEVPDALAYQNKEASESILNQDEIDCLLGKKKASKADLLARETIKKWSV